MIADMFRDNQKILMGFDYLTGILFVEMGTGIWLVPVFSKIFLKIILIPRFREVKHQEILSVFSTRGY